MSGLVAHLERIERAIRGEPLRLRLFGVPASPREAEIDGWIVARDADGRPTGVLVFTALAAAAFLAAGWRRAGEVDGWTLLVRREG